MDMSFTTDLKDAKVNAIVAWYRTDFLGATLVRSTPGDRMQDTFFMPERLRQVTITGTPNSDAAYSISFVRFAALLTAKEAATFSTGSAQSPRGWQGAGWGLTCFGLGFVVIRFTFARWPDRVGGVPVALVSLAVEVVGQCLLWLAPTPVLAMAGALLSGMAARWSFRRWASRP